MKTRGLPILAFALAMMFALSPLSYAAVGFIYALGPWGDQGTFPVLGQSNIIVDASADHVATQPEYAGEALYVTSTGALSAPAKVVLPLVQGETKVVYNATTGGQNLVVGGATGTTVTIATNSLALVNCPDGANYVAVSGGGAGGGFDAAAYSGTGFLSWDGATLLWKSVVCADLPAITLTGDTTGAMSGCSIATKTALLNGAQVPEAGALTFGNVLQVSDAAALTYGALNLANGASVTSVLPNTNQAPQVMAGDISGTTDASVVRSASGVADNAYVDGGANFNVDAGETRICDTTAASGKACARGAIIHSPSFTDNSTWVTVAWHIPANRSAAVYEWEYVVADQTDTIDAGVVDMATCHLIYTVGVSNGGNITITGFQGSAIGTTVALVPQSCTVTLADAGASSSAFQFQTTVSGTQVLLQGKGLASKTYDITSFALTHIGGL